MNDSDLLDGLKRQDPAAVKHLTECYVPSVWRMVYVRVNRDEHLAEDVVSESVLALLRAVKDDRAVIQNVIAWLRAVASNKIADHFRAAARVQHLLEETQQTAELVDDVEAAHEQELEERRQEVRTVLEGMSEKSRLALEWKYVDKLSVLKIAERLGTTEKAAESVLFRSRREFRDRLTVKDRQIEHDVVNGRVVADSATGSLNHNRNGHPTNGRTTTKTNGNTANGTHVTETKATSEPK